MPEYQLRQDKYGMYYNEPVYSEEELAEIEEQKKKKEVTEKLRADAELIKAKAKK